MAQEINSYTHTHRERERGDFYADLLCAVLGPQSRCALLSWLVRCAFVALFCCVFSGGGGRIGGEWIGGVRGGWKDIVVGVFAVLGCWVVVAVVVFFSSKISDTILS